jgi:exonuclease SbcD
MRKEEHQAVIDWLLAQVEKEQVDAVIIAGDIFDTVTPPCYAREMHQFVVDFLSLIR